MPPTSPRLSQRTEAGGILADSFHEASGTLMSKWEKATRGRKTGSISAVNGDAKILHKMLAKWAQQRIRRIILSDWVGFIPVAQDGSMSENQTRNPSRQLAKETTWCDHIDGRRKLIWQNSTPIHNSKNEKHCQHTGTREERARFDKEYVQKAYSCRRS